METSFVIGVSGDPDLEDELRHAYWESELALDSERGAEGLKTWASLAPREPGAKPKKRKRKEKKMSTARPKLPSPIEVVTNYYLHGRDRGESRWQYFPSDDQDTRALFYADPGSFNFSSNEVEVEKNAEAWICQETLNEENDLLRGAFRALFDAPDEHSVSALFQLAPGRPTTAPIQTSANYR